ncbi:MAG TPA: hypothetical protein VMR52_01835 [Dehalococcoidia bacterium]|nr:hypothetical protein [Dehalococcoidia bacterium]
MSSAIQRATLLSELSIASGAKPLFARYWLMMLRNAFSSESSASALRVPIVETAMTKIAATSGSTAKNRAIVSHWEANVGVCFSAIRVLGSFLISIVGMGVMFSIPQLEMNLEITRYPRAEELWFWMS